MARSRPPSIVRGGRPSVEARVAPMSRSGAATRSTGRRRSDSSPVRTLRNGRPARAPASIRIVEPEFSQSSTACGARQASTPGPSIATCAPSRAHRRAERAQARERRRAVGSLRVVVDGRRAAGHRAEDRRAVRDRLVAGEAKAAAEAPCGTDLQGRGAMVARVACPSSCSRRQPQPGPILAGGGRARSGRRSLSSSCSSRRGSASARRPPAEDAAVAPARGGAGSRSSPRRSALRGDVRPRQYLGVVGPRVGVARHARPARPSCGCTR